MDFITGLPSSSSIHGKTCDSILVVVDRLTKYAVYIKTSSKLTAEGLANLLIYHVFSHFRLPAGIMSDRGTLFTSKF
ncbi:hypothetical protein IMZ48_43660 [Candidatus Bathyarchaeota archaeon]|nr:hypothetical protein [Candidatus Bathyarchaeota archaeon]